MARQYLDVPYRSKDAAKALGARFDGTVKRWYVEPGVDLVAFTAWLPADVKSAGTTELAISAKNTGLATLKNGISLSRLLNNVAVAVAQAFANGVWTLVEVNEATARSGHVYLDLSERDSNGQLIAKARATIWASTAARILPEFERATGAVIGAGIKLLVRAKPVFKSQYGFSLDIDAIDAEYTLGDLEARKKEIRSRLQHEGIFDRNRGLPQPWDYRLVLVVAPQDAAGLGDFQKEAERLTSFGVCRFVYAHSRFQGEGAAGEIVACACAALAALELPGGQHQQSHGGQANVVSSARADAIVLIRGGGATNDLAWLNDYELARFICNQSIPVLTGIGHERDSTLPDEVANMSFDTPSKVIAGIEQQIRRRAVEARNAWETVVNSSGKSTRNTRLAIERKEAQIRADAQEHLARARQHSTAALNAVAVGAVHQVHDAARQSLSLLTKVREESMQRLATAQQRVPALMANIRVDALKTIGDSRTASVVEYNSILDRAAAASRSANQDIDTRLQRVAERAAGKVLEARRSAQALMREITGQGPSKTLARGFAIVRSPEGKPVSSSKQACGAATLNIQFRDGVVATRPDRIIEGE